MRFFVCSILLLLVLIAFYCLDDGVHVVFWQINLLFRQFFHAFFISKNVPVSYCILATCQAHSQYLCYWCWKNAVVFSLTFRRTKQKFGCCLRKIVSLWHNNRSHFPFFYFLWSFSFVNESAQKCVFYNFFTRQNKNSANRAIKRSMKLLLNIPSLRWRFLWISVAALKSFCCNTNTRQSTRFKHVGVCMVCIT